MATTHRSDLTTELEKTLTDEAYDGGSGALSDEHFSRYVRRLAEAAAEVVASVHAPTDDEREALARVIEQGWGNPTWDGKTLRPIDRQIADAVLAAGFRRSEAPETDVASAVTEPRERVARSEAVNRGAHGHVWPCPLFYVGNWSSEGFPQAKCANAGVCTVAERPEEGGA